MSGETKAPLKSPRIDSGAEVSPPTHRHYGRPPTEQHPQWVNPGGLPGGYRPDLRRRPPTDRVAQTTAPDPPERLGAVLSRPGLLRRFDLLQTGELLEQSLRDGGDLIGGRVVGQAADRPAVLPQGRAECCAVSVSIFMMLPKGCAASPQTVRKMVVTSHRLSPVRIGFAQVSGM